MNDPGTLLLADERTLDALDFETIRERVVAAAVTQRGRRFAASMEPYAEFAEVRVQQARTQSVRHLVVAADFHVLPSIDTQPYTQAASVGRTLGAADLRAVGEAISAAAAAFNAVREARDETLSPVLAPYQPLRDLVRDLTDAIDERGVVLDRASPALSRIRRGMSQAQADARDRVASILRSDKYARAIQDSVVTVREGRFVVPVKAEFQGEFPGIVHDTSSSGQTLFIEPLGALDANNRLRTLRIDEEREVQRILEQFSRLVGASADAIEANVAMLAELDLLVAKAQVARAMDAIAPELTQEPVIAVERARHPLLGEKAIPQSLALDEQTRLLVISGPNMGGKTVALKTVGLFVLMTYCGMQVPAAQGTRVGCFERIVADIGDEQSIVGNASTFSAHLARMREMLDGANARTLVLVDEIGGGTEPTAGAALAVAMLERLLAVRACGVVTTHATELKLFASGTPGVTNANVRFDPQTFAPTYQLDIGAPGQSLAFPLARALGIDETIVARAQSLLDTSERDYESALAELSERSMELHDEREAVRFERRDLQRERADVARRREELDDERRRFTENAETRMQQALRDFVAELQRRADANTAARPRVTAAQSDLLTRTVNEMRKTLGIKDVSETPPDDGSLKPGELVRVNTLRQNGSVVEDYGDSVLVAIGPMKTVVKKVDLSRRARTQEERVAAKRERRAEREAGAGDAKLQVAARATSELDVRGKRYVDAEPVVDRWLDEATLAGQSPLRLIHGKGTGLLGRGLQEFLRSHPAVKSVRYGSEDEGSAGVSIIELR